MKGEYDHVGPALFEIGMAGNEAAYVRHASTGVIAEPREVFLPINRTWLRLDGQWISGWDGDLHFSFRPTWLNRWKIRRAAKRWIKTQEQSA